MVWGPSPFLALSPNKLLYGWQQYKLFNKCKLLFFNIMNSTFLNRKGQIKSNNYNNYFCNPSIKHQKCKKLPPPQ